MGKRNYHKKTTDNELDTRDMHLGIRKIKSEYQPVTYHFKDNGKKTLNRKIGRSLLQIIYKTTNGGNNQASQIGQKTRL